MADTGSSGSPAPGAPRHGADVEADLLFAHETERNVDAMLETVRGLLAAEESRDQSFTSRGVGLAALVGIVVSLSTSLGRDALSTGLGGWWKGLAVTLLPLHWFCSSLPR
jgi:hypothetical protein